MKRRRRGAGEGGVEREPAWVNETKRNVPRGTNGNTLAFFSRRARVQGGPTTSIASCRDGRASLALGCVVSVLRSSPLSAPHVTTRARAPHARCFATRSRALGEPAGAPPPGAPRASRLHPVRLASVALGPPPACAISRAPSEIPRGDY